MRKVENILSDIKEALNGASPINVESFIKDISSNLKVYNEAGYFFGVDKVAVQKALVDMQVTPTLGVAEDLKSKLYFLTLKELYENTLVSSVTLKLAIENRLGLLKGEPLLAWKISNKVAPDSKAVGVTTVCKESSVGEASKAVGATTAQITTFGVVAKTGKSNAGAFGVTPRSNPVVEHAKRLLGQ